LYSPPFLHDTTLNGFISVGPIDSLEPTLFLIMRIDVGHAYVQPTLNL
jgi:hypothetical protein